MKTITKQDKVSKSLVMEDMRYLQKKITGRSVYRSLDIIYLRKPKHKSIAYQHYN